MSYPDLFIHVLPHSHDDVGWLATVDDYFSGSKYSSLRASVEQTIDTAVRAVRPEEESLGIGRNRRYNIVEMAFLSRWWKKQTNSMKDLFFDLVNDDRISIVNGAWAMHDEATPHYLDMTDQITLGHQFAYSTFGVSPRIAWQLDPFGHSSTSAHLNYLAGMDSLVFARVDKTENHWRREHGIAAFRWDIANASSINTLLLPKHYSSPHDMSFDPRFTTDLVEDDKSLTSFNLLKYTSILSDEIVDLESAFKNSGAPNHVPLIFGDDFTHVSTHMSLSNLEKVVSSMEGKILKMNDGTNRSIKFRYSSPEEFFQARAEAMNAFPFNTLNNQNKKQNTTLQKVKDHRDFFPYLDNDTSTWSAYFSARPTLKRRIRLASSILKTVERLAASCLLVSIEHSSSEITRKLSAVLDDYLFPLRDALALVQHHDGITGTSREPVAVDYHRRIDEGLAVVQSLIPDMIQYLKSNGNHSPLLDNSTSKKNPIDLCTYADLGACDNSDAGATQDGAIIIIEPNREDHVIFIPVSNSVSDAEFVEHTQDSSISATTITADVLGTLDRMDFQSNEAQSKVKEGNTDLLIQIRSSENASTSPSTDTSFSLDSNDELLLKLDDTRTVKVVPRLQVYRPCPQVGPADKWTQYTGAYLMNVCMSQTDAQPGYVELFELEKAEKPADFPLNEINHNSVSPEDGRGSIDADVAAIHKDLSELKRPIPVELDSKKSINNQSSDGCSRVFYRIKNAKKNGWTLNEKQFAGLAITLCGNNAVSVDVQLPRQPVPAIVSLTFDVEGLTDVHEDPIGMMTDSNGLLDEFRAPGTVKDYPGFINYNPVPNSIYPSTRRVMLPLDRKVDLMEDENPSDEVEKLPFELKEMANFADVTSGSFLEVHLDRAQGISSLRRGQLDVILLVNSNSDDRRGLDRPMVERMLEFYPYNHPNPSMGHFDSAQHDRDDAAYVSPHRSMFRSTIRLTAFNLKRMPEGNLSEKWSKVKISSHAMSLVNEQATLFFKSNLLSKTEANGESEKSVHVIPVNPPSRLVQTNVFVSQFAPLPRHNAVAGQVRHAHEELEHEVIFFARLFNPSLSSKSISLSDILTLPVLAKTRCVETNLSMTRIAVHTDALRRISPGENSLNNEAIEKAEDAMRFAEEHSDITAYEIHEVVLQPNDLKTVICGMRGTAEDAWFKRLHDLGIKAIQKSKKPLEYLGPAAIAEDKVSSLKSEQIEYY